MHRDGAAAVHRFFLFFLQNNFCSTLTNMMDNCETSATQAWRMPHIVFKILSNLDTDHLKQARLVNHSCNTEACRLLRKRVIINIEDAVSLEKFLNFGFENSINLPYIQFLCPVQETPSPWLANLYSRLETIYHENGKSCGPDYLTSWSNPKLEEDGSVFLSTLVTEASRLIRLDFRTRFSHPFSKMTRQFPPIPAELHSSRLPRLQSIHDNWRVSEHNANFGYVSMFTKLVELSPSLQELRIGHPLTLLEILERQRTIPLKKLKTLSLEILNKTEAERMFTMLSIHPVVKQIKQLDLSFFGESLSIEAINAQIQLISAVSPTLAVLYTNSGLYDQEESLTGIEMKSLKSLNAPYKLAAGWMTASTNNFPVLEILTIHFDRPLETKKKFTLTPPQTVVKLMVTISDEIVGDKELSKEFGDMIAKFGKIQDLAFNMRQVNFGWQNRDGRLADWLHLISKWFPKSIQNFRLHLLGSYEDEFDFVWDFLKKRDGGDGDLFPKIAFPEIKTVELMQHFRKRCSRDFGRKPVKRVHNFGQE